MLLICIADIRCLCWIATIHLWIFRRNPMPTTHKARKYLFLFCNDMFIDVSFMCVFFFFLIFLFGLGYWALNAMWKNANIAYKHTAGFTEKANETNTHASSFRLVLCVHYSIIPSLFSFPFTPCHSIYAIRLIHVMLHRNYTQYIHMYRRSSIVQDDNRCFQVIFYVDRIKANGKSIG